MKLELHRWFKRLSESASAPRFQRGLSFHASRTGKIHLMLYGGFAGFVSGGVK